MNVRAIENKSGALSELRDSLYESAVSAINAHDYARALDYLHEKRSRDPRDVKALNALGVVYDKLGRFDLSARYYNEARAIEPESQIVARNMGYSKALKDLVAPAAPTAVATIDLPPGWNDGPLEKQPAKGVTVSAVSDHANDPVEQYQVRMASATPVAVNAVVPEQSQPAVPRILAAALPKKKYVLTIGSSIKILNASGKADRVRAISHRLATLGWTVRQSDFNRVQQLTTIYYPAQNALAAKAMRNTLPFPVRLMRDTDGTSNVRLVVGRDYLSWRPKSDHIRALWQSGITVASLQKASNKGVR